MSILYKKSEVLFFVKFLEKNYWLESYDNFSTCQSGFVKVVLNESSKNKNK